MRKVIVNLGSKIGKNKNNSSPQLAYPQNSLLIIIVDTPENRLSNAEREYNMRKVLTS